MTEDDRDMWRTRALIAERRRDAQEPVVQAALTWVMARNSGVSITSAEDALMRAATRFWEEHARD